VTKKPDTGDAASPTRGTRLLLQTAATVVLLATAGLALREPAPPPAASPGTTPHQRAAPEPAPAPVAPNPPRQVASANPPGTGQPAVIPSPEAVAPPEEQTLYLTIVGDKVYRVMGPVSGRPPRIEQLTAPGAGQGLAAASSSGVVAERPGAGFVIADSEPPAPVLGPDERPMGPAPQECPRTLPPGTDQATVDGLRRQSGCRYLSSCTADTNECTFFYQGRG